MDTYKQICAKLVEAWDSTADGEYEDFGRAASCLVDWTRDALAEAEPEGPTDADLHAMAFSYSQPCYQFEYIPFARSVLARWGSDQGNIRSGLGSPLVERVADAIAGEATSAGIVNDRPARAAILQVAKWLREQGTPASDWAIHLEQEATSSSRLGATS